jgi:hypothetical protein
VECQIGAFDPQLPENAEITISFVLDGLIAIDGSPSLAVSVLVRVGSVLLTTQSLTNAVGKIEVGKFCWGSARRPPGALSSLIAGRA